MGTLGSIWRLPRIARLLQYEGVVAGALRQSDWGRDFINPTRILGKFDGLSKILSCGMPKFDDGDGKYLGPLPWEPSSGQKRLIGQAGGGYKTAAVAPWPPALCRELASMVNAGSACLNVARKCHDEDPHAL